MSFLGSRSLVFLGTPEPAAFVLRRLVDEGFPIESVVTRRDARRGRGAEVSPSPVKTVALEAGIEVRHDLDRLSTAPPGHLLGVVVAYGRIIPTPVLEVVPMVNLHFSLLPRWRGAAPVERAILAGDDTTGVCLMEVVPDLDAGGVYSNAEVKVADLTAARLTEVLARTGADLLVDLLRGAPVDPVPQSGEVTYADKVRPDEGRIDWRRDAREIVRVVRALRAYTESEGRRLIVHEAEVVGTDVDRSPGSCGPDAVVGCGVGSVRLVTVQPEGKPPMDGVQWRRGRRGDLVVLGDPGMTHDPR